MNQVHGIRHQKEMNPLSLNLHILSTWKINFGG